MGSFNVTCAFSNLPISDGEEMCGLVVKLAPWARDGSPLYPFEVFEPVTPLFFGKYDDYGRIKLSEEETTRATEFAKRAIVEIDPEESYFGVENGFWFVAFRRDIFDGLGMIPWGDEFPLQVVLDEWKREIIETAKDIIASRVDEQPNINTVMGPFKIATFISSRTYEFGQTMRQHLIQPISDYLQTDDFTLAGLEAMLQPLVDLMRLHKGLMASRRILHPVGTVGPSQEWDTPALLAVNNMIANVLAKRQEQEQQWMREDEEEIEDADG